MNYLQLNRIVYTQQIKCNHTVPDRKQTEWRKNLKTIGSYQKWFQGCLEMELSGKAAIVTSSSCIRVYDKD